MLFFSVLPDTQQTSKYSNAFIILFCKFFHFGVSVSLSLQMRYINYEKENDHDDETHLFKLFFVIMYALSSDIVF